MLALRHLSVLALLSSCSVYSEALVDGVTSKVEDGSQAGSKPTTSGGGNQGGAGSSPTTGTAGGGKAPEEMEPEGGAGAVSNGGTSSAGMAGTTSSAGAEGGVAPGGGAAGAGPVLPTGIDLLDDLEDGNFYLSPRPPRFGYWYVASDNSEGSSVPEIAKLVAKMSPAREDSTLAVHFVASDATGWGASVGLSFTDSNNVRKAYDAGNAAGLAFWIKGTVAEGGMLRVQFPSVATEPSGKLCGGTGQGQCLDHFGKTISVSEEWTQVKIPFAAIYQSGWGALVATGFDPATMLGIEWSAEKADVDIWIDDLALLRPE